MFSFSALQRAEIAEMDEDVQTVYIDLHGFSALQRAEIAEMRFSDAGAPARSAVSVLFNEPKLLKLSTGTGTTSRRPGFSALQRAEIAEIYGVIYSVYRTEEFQCSSTSRNC